MLRGHYESEDRTDPFPTDFFESEGIFAFYDAQGGAEAFEFCEPADVYLNDMNLLNIPYREVVRFLRGLDPGVDTDEGGCTSLELGLGASVPTEGKPSKRPPATVIVFRRGYYAKS